MFVRALLPVLAACLILPAFPAGVHSGEAPLRRVLLIGQGPDNHPWSTHEYMAGVELLARGLQQQDGLQVIVTRADEPWADGPELLDNADAAVVFVSQGAQWLQNDPQRLAAFRRLAGRKGGLAVLHWGMGTREAEPVADFVALFGACHGGPDRRYKVLETTLRPASAGHPVLSGLEPFAIHDEFYYTLKQTSEPGLLPLLAAEIDDAPHMVAWGWERPDGGRSFGFSGLHFHRNWERDEYRRLVLQGVLWTLGRPIPESGVEFPVTPADLEVAPRPERKSRAQ